MQPALFLDRDGVVNVERKYVYRIADFEFMPGIFNLCRQAVQRGYLIVIISNQAGIARGFYTEQDFEKLTQWMLEQFKQQGIQIKAVYHCPHHPDFGPPCSCRKPEPGMILAAQKDHDLDLAHSILLGDKVCDLEAGQRAGIPTNIRVSGNSIRSAMVPWNV